MLGIYLIFLSAGACLAQIAFPDVCPDLQAKGNFEVTRYVGKWYEAAKYPTRFEQDGKCNTATYTPNTDGTVRVENAMISTITGEIESITGTARFAGDSDVGKLLVTFSTDPSGREASYWVMDTDYDSFAVVWGCQNVGETSVRFAWILTREQNPEESVLKQAYDVIDNNNISREYLTTTDQTNC